MNHAKLPTKAQLKEEIIHVLLKHARENGRYACMRPSDIGRGIGTYRLEYKKRASDPLSRKHHELLKELEEEGRVERVWNERRTKSRWRLTEAEYNRLTEV